MTLELAPMARPRQTQQLLSHPITYLSRAMDPRPPSRCKFGCAFSCFLETTVRQYDHSELGH
jgi:hypothetical protein